jgi:hypothetical protein
LAGVGVLCQVVVWGIQAGGWHGAAENVDRAFDGSGVVKRGKANYELATFKSGKQYNCDLNATYNIAAKYWLVHKKDKVSRGKSSTTTPRSRAITLSMLWESR